MVLESNLPAHYQRERRTHVEHALIYLYQLQPYGEKPAYRNENEANDNPRAYGLSPRKK